MVAIQDIIINSDYLPSIEELGGEEFIWTEADKLNTSNVFPEIVEILLNDFNLINDRNNFNKFILDGLKNNNHFQVFDDAINIILVEEDKIKNIFPDIADILISKIKIRNSDQEAFISSSALNAGVQLALKKYINKHRILAELTDIKDNENPIFARKAIRLIGVCFENWKELDLIESLNRILYIEETNSDVYYELGMTNILQAFESTSEDLLICKLQKAKEYLIQSINNDEERLDAEIYNKVIDIFLSLKNISSIELLNSYVDELDKLIDIRHKWLFNTDESWLTPRYTSEIEWLRLSLEIKDLIEHIKKDSPSEPWLLLERMINVFKSSRSVKLRSSVLDLSKIIEPEINSQLINFQSTRDGLIKWLKSDYIKSEYKEESNSLLNKIITFQKKNIPDLTKLNNPLLNPYELLGLKEGELSNDEILLLSKYNEGLGIAGFSNIVLDSIYKDIIEQLNNTKFFTGSIKHNFCTIFGQLLKFLASRANIGNRGRYKYLFDQNAVENDLADDLKDFLDGGIYYGKVHSEVRDVSGGRVDLYINFQGYNFVAELKREFNDVSRENLRKEYEAQVGTYQACGLNLSFLIVLDLTPKNAGLSSILSNVWLDVIPHQKEGDLEKNIVVICIPGNKTSPSKTKLVENSI